MFNLPDSPVNTALLVGATTVVALTAYCKHKQNVVVLDASARALEARQIDAEMQATMLATIKELNSKI